MFTFRSLRGNICELLPEIMVTFGDLWHEMKEKSLYYQLVYNVCQSTLFEPPQIPRRTPAFPTKKNEIFNSNCNDTIVGYSMQGDIHFPFASPQHFVNIYRQIIA